MAYREIVNQKEMNQNGIHNIIVILNHDNGWAKITMFDQRDVRFLESDRPLVTNLSYFELLYHIARYAMQDIEQILRVS